MKEKELQTRELGRQRDEQLELELKYTQHGDRNHEHHQLRAGHQDDEGAL
jgi:hypothetical protein